MTVTESFRLYVSEQLSRIRPITTRPMFGGVGVYADGLFFALIDDDVLYFKVDDSNRPDFEEHGMGPFRPFGPEGSVMRYYEVPGEVLDDPDTMPEWMDKALRTAKTAKRKRR